MNHPNYRRKTLRRLHLIGAAFLVLTVLVVIAAHQFNTDATAAVFTTVFGVTLIFAQDSWLDF